MPSHAPTHRVSVGADGFDIMRRKPTAFLGNLAQGLANCCLHLDERMASCAPANNVLEEGLVDVDGLRVCVGLGLATLKQHLSGLRDEFCPRRILC